MNIIGKNLTVGIYDYIPSAIVILVIADLEVGAGRLVDVIEDVDVVFVIVDVANVLVVVVVVTGNVVVSSVDVVTIVDFEKVAVFVVVVFMGKFDVNLQFSSFFEIRCSMSNSIWLEFRCEGKGYLNFLAYARLNFLCHFTIVGNIDLMSHPCKFAKSTQKSILT